MDKHERELIYSLITRLCDLDDELTPVQRLDILNELCHENCKMALYDIINGSQSRHPLQIRRGTAMEHNNFTGKIGEITMDITNNTLRVHDGQTPGGTILAKQSEIPQQQTLPDNYDFVVASQLPTAENNYTWYRKYKSGWVEQGGFLANSINGVVIFLPVVMNNTYYNINIQSRLDAYGTVTNTGSVGNISTTSFIHYHYNDTNQNWSWEVKGFAA